MAGLTGTLNVAVGLIASLAVGMAGCKGEAGPPDAQTATEVQVVKVIRQDVPIYSEWVGTAEGLVNAKIRAQVTGYLLAQHYQEGAFIKKGDLLFEIDPRKFQAALDQAKGELEKARAQLGKTELDVKRDTPLARSGAISQKELDDSVQANLAAKASVAAARATVEQALLNVNFTRIVAPIDGIVGIAKAQIGDLVGPGDELAAMSTLDPIRVYFPVSEQEYFRAADRVREAYKAREQGQTRPDNLDMILADGTVYPHKGTFFLADRQVDVKTGTIRIAALFPNPDNLLRPGQFARVRAVTQTKEGALLVPQRAVTELQGGYHVAVVTDDNKVEDRSVKVGTRVGALWVIDEGLEPTATVVTEGLQKVKPGMTVTPKTFAPEVATQEG
jgi:membrane fusion protein (multidrug efflux system)